MLFILLSWIYILTISSIVGVSLNRLFCIQEQHSVITLSIGFFGTTLLTALYAFRFPIDAYFQIVLFLICLILLFINRTLIISYVKLIKQEVKSLNKFYKVLFSTIFILILAQCASPPFVIDNESYYVQTIKWLNEYGFVKGLVNLHLFLGQSSGWHILQSAFNFSFIYHRFNDLSGLMLLLGNFYAISHLNSYTNKTDKTKINLAIGLFPVFNVFFFQFISAPSPDVAIYVLALIVFHQFILCYQEYNKSIFLSLVLVVLFMIFIKPTALLFCLLPLILFKRYYVFTRSTKIYIVSLSIITFLLIGVKNLILTGNLFFPLQFMNSFQMSWSLPSDVQTYFSMYGKASAYHLSLDSFESASWFIRLKNWLLAPGLHGVFNKAIVALLIIMPIVLKKFYNKLEYWTFYILGLLSLLLLFNISPQYRFYFPFVMLFNLLVLALLILDKKSIQVVLVACTLFTAIPMFFEMNNKKLTTNSNHTTSSQFKMAYSIQPHSNSKYVINYKTKHVGNLELNCPIEIDFFWATGDIPIPALSQEQLEYFKNNFNVIPQQSSDNLKEGFYSKHIKPE